MHNSMTAELLSLPLPEALKAIGSFNTLDYLPDSICEPVQDLVDTALACFPEAQAAFWELMDAQSSSQMEGSFNYVLDAYRLLLPAVEGARYPLSAQNGVQDVVLDADTPLLVMLPKVQAMELDATFPATEGPLYHYQTAEDPTPMTMVTGLVAGDKGHGHVVRLRSDAA